MRHFKNQLKDAEVPTLLFLVEHLLDEFFGKEYNYIRDNDIEDFIKKADSANSNIKPISSTVLKRILAMKDSDTGYRPKYESIEFVIFGLLGIKRTFLRYQKDHKQEIENYFKALDYTIIVKNPQKTSISGSKNHKKMATANLGDMQVTFSMGEGFIEKVVKDVSVFTGDLLKEEIKQKPKTFGIFPKQMINERLRLKEQRRQSNIDNIVAKAIEFARKGEASNNPTDPDWVVEFFNIAQDCSDENMQYLWAKLLANEIKNPNSYSRRTLTTIKLLNPYEALVFTKLCCCIWDLEESHFGREKMLIKDMDSNGRYSDETWDFNGSFISHLEEVGLVYDSFLQFDDKKMYNATFFGKKHQLKAKLKEQQIDVVALTQVGEEVFKIIKIIPNKDYYKATIQYFEDVNILES